MDKLIGSFGLPSPACLSLRLLELGSGDDASAMGFARLIGLDPALSASVLKFANARLMGRASPVPTARDAVMRIGVRAARVVAFSQLLVALQSSRREHRTSLGGVWSRALARGIAARSFADEAAPRRSEEAQQAGILAEVSRLALRAAEPETAERLAWADLKGAAASLEAERLVFGCSAFAASAELMRAWRFPKRLWSAVQALDPGTTVAHAVEAGEQATLASVLRAAERLATGFTEPSETFDTRAALMLLGISEERLESAVRHAESRWKAERSLIEPVENEPGASAEVERRVASALTEISLATQLENRVMKRRQDELLRRVTTDALTGVKNRLAFDERLGEELERAQRSARPLTLLMCDLDGFKGFNDRNGHQAGDLMLRAAAEAMTTAARKIDLVARYGGEEFAVIAPQCGHEGAVALAERLRRAVKGTQIEWRGSPLSLTVSIGGAICTGAGSQRSPSEMIEAADRLLYAAKDAGRDRCFLEPLPSVTTGTIASINVPETTG